MHELPKEYGLTLVQVVLILIIFAVIGAVGYSLTDRHAVKQLRPAAVASSSTELVISRSNPLHQPDIIAFAAKVTSSSTAEALLSDIQQLPSMPKGSTNCPLDNGALYKLQFSQPKLTATFNAGSCLQVTLSNSKTIFTAETNNPSGSVFLNTLSQAIGQPVDIVQP